MANGRSLHQLEIFIAQAVERVLLNAYKVPRGHHGGIPSCRRHKRNLDLKKIEKHLRQLERLESTDD